MRFRQIPHGGHFFHDTEILTRSTPSRGEKAYHALWETTPSHCLDLDSGHLSVDEMSLEAFWKYFAKPANTVLWKSECPRNDGGGVLRVHCFAGLLVTTSASAWPPVVSL